jgi:1-acyl-sn-glycerol-3-phosphate acyltransferase
MQKLMSYPLTVLHFILFALALLIFHPIQHICLKVFGYQAHKNSVDILNWCLMKTMLPLGNSFKFTFKEQLPVGPSYIFVCNHQSMFDIPPLIWNLRAYHAKFIAKIELAKGIPSISLNLRVGENCAVDRKDPRQALTALLKFAKNAHARKRSVVIFAEGSRSRTGKPKPFKTRGLLTLFKYMPDAVVVPVTINHAWKINKYGKFPYGIGNRVEVTVHSPMPIANQDHETLIKLTEKTVHDAVTV